MTRLLTRKCNLRWSLQAMVAANLNAFILVLAFSEATAPTGSRAPPATMWYRARKVVLNETLRTFCMICLVLSYKTDIDGLRKSLAVAHCDSSRLYSHKMFLRNRNSYVQNISLKNYPIIRDPKGRSSGLFFNSQVPHTQGFLVWSWRSATNQTDSNSSVTFTPWMIGNIQHFSKQPQEIDEYMRNLNGLLNM